MDLVEELDLLSWPPPGQVVIKAYRGYQLRLTSRTFKLGEGPRIWRTLVMGDAELTCSVNHIADRLDRDQIMRDIVDMICSRTPSYVPLAAGDDDGS